MPRPRNPVDSGGSEDAGGDEPVPASLGGGVAMAGSGVGCLMVLSVPVLVVSPVAGVESPTENLFPSALEVSIILNGVGVAVSVVVVVRRPGIMTSRAAAEAFFIAGTNRAMFRFTLLNHMCNDMEQMHDTRLPPDRIRQDVSRSPGGDSRLFLNSCIGCHSGMDPMAGAFAYYNYDENAVQLVYNSSAVHSKYFNNDLNFPQGYRTVDDSWINRWREGQNSYLGFDGALNGDGSGNGAKSLGVELGNSDAFASCQVKKVFRTICLRDTENQPDRDAVATITGVFRSTGYSMKQVFADVAVHCMGP